MLHFKQCIHTVNTDDYYFFSLSFYREFFLCNYEDFIHITFYDHFKLHEFTWSAHTLEI